MQNNKIPTWSSIVASLTAQASLMLLVPVIVGLDLMRYGGGIRETSLTEFTQEILIIASAIIFAIGAYRKRFARGGLTLVAGFMGCIAIREMDMYLDRIFHGFWVYPASALALVSIAYAVSCRRTVVKPLLWYSREKFFTYISVGFLILLFFSRLFGTSEIWNLALEGGEGVTAVKSTVQEGLELLGYMLVFIGAFLFQFRKPFFSEEDLQR